MVQGMFRISLLYVSSLFENHVKIASDLTNIVRTSTNVGGVVKSGSLVCGQLAEVMSAIVKWHEEVGINLCDEDDMFYMSSLGFLDTHIQAYTTRQVMRRATSILKVDGLQRMSAIQQALNKLDLNTIDVAGEPQAVVNRLAKAIVFAPEPYYRYTFEDRVYAYIRKKNNEILARYPMAYNTTTIFSEMPINDNGTLSAYVSMACSAMMERICTIVKGGMKRTYDLSNATLSNPMLFLMANGLWVEVCIHTNKKTGHQMCTRACGPLDQCKCESRSIIEVVSQHRVIQKIVCASTQRGMAAPKTEIVLSDYVRPAETIVPIPETLSQTVCFTATTNVGLTREQMKYVPMILSKTPSSSSKESTLTCLLKKWDKPIVNVDNICTEETLFDYIGAYHPPDIRVNHFSDLNKLCELILSVFDQPRSLAEVVDKCTLAGCLRSIAERGAVGFKENIEDRIKQMRDAKLGISKKKKH
jgi:hypothetical protein